MRGYLLSDDQNTKPTIAFVDDETEITEVYSAILSEYYNVLTFNHPEEFLRFLESHEECPFEVLITDLKMPRISGLQLIERAHQKGFQFPSLLLSGYLDKKNLMTAVGTGILRVIEKPAEIHSILLCVEDLLNESRLIKTRRQIQEILQKLRESYAHIRLLLGDELQTLSVDKDSNMELLLESLNVRLDFLLKTEEVLKGKNQRIKQVI